MNNLYFQKTKIILSIFLMFILVIQKGSIKKDNLSAVGFGKIILFNEHFVVYNVSAIAAALPQKVTSTIIKSDKFELYPKILEKEDTLKAINKILELLNLKKEKLKFTLAFESQIKPGSGIGSSAAFAVAAIKVLSKYLNLNLSNQKINEIAYEVEKIFHKNPSGIDNTISTYQGIILFKKENPKIVKQINFKEPLIFVIGESGNKSYIHPEQCRGTKKAVEKVRKLKDKNSEKFDLLLNKANKIATKSLKAITNFDLQKIGNLMDKNHKLLQQIKVSTPGLDKLVSIAKRNGALGAKLTGGGLGGNMIALAKDEIDANKILNAFRKEKFNCFIVKTKNRNLYDFEGEI